MSQSPETSPHRAAAYHRQLFSKTLLRQRWLVLCGGAAYAVICLWIAFRVGLPPSFAIASFALLGVTLALYGLTYGKNTGPVLLEMIPTLMAAAFTAHIIHGTAGAPQAGAARLAVLLTLLGLWVLIATPRLRGTLVALAVSAAVALAGIFFYMPDVGVTHFAAAEALSYWLPALAATTAVAFFLEHERHNAFDLRRELERRATSDNLTGVSNRAHINLLAQNEFARARRYREPFSCLMIEIDGYEALMEKWGDTAITVIVQVFTGYCVVVMRHCDSFGRLGPYRFLALLPETRGVGAHTLASRMCRDLGALNVLVEGQTLNFTVSIGAAELHGTDRWAGDLLRRVEQGLEDAIERGRGQAVFASPPVPPPLDDDADTTEDSGLFLPQ